MMTMMLGAARPSIAHNRQQINNCTRSRSILFHFNVITVLLGAFVETQGQRLRLGLLSLVAGFAHTTGRLARVCTRVEFSSGAGIKMGVIKRAGHRIDAAGFPLKRLDEQVADKESGSSAPALHMRELNLTFCSFHFNFFILPAIDRLAMRDYPLFLQPISPHFESHPIKTSCCDCQFRGWECKS